MRMLKPRGDGDLAQEPLGAKGAREVGPEHLDRDASAMSRVLRRVHRGHAAGAHLAFEPVSVAKRSLECVEGAGHGVGHGAIVRSCATTPQANCLAKWGQTRF